MHTKGRTKTAVDARGPLSLHLTTHETHFTSHWLSWDSRSHLRSLRYRESVLGSRIDELKCLIKLCNYYKYTLLTALNLSV
jgi:hypothetical protein